MKGRSVGYGVLTLLLSINLRAQVILPFDWSGQSGLMVHQGSVLWNRDWTSGPLYFDGTFTSYPMRYGGNTYDRFQISKLGDISQFISLPDSAEITSYFDYYRGDHLYDQLGIGANFGEQDRLISLDAFKRRYGGDQGHYLYPEGGIVPIQQSYRLGYHTGWGQNRLEAGIGRFITRSGLPDSTFNGSIDDDIFTAGVRGNVIFPALTLHYRIAQFQQQRKVIHSTRNDSSNSFLNRTHISGRIGAQSGYALGFQADMQAVIMDTIISVHRAFNSDGVNASGELRRLSWMTLYGEKQLGDWRLMAGYSFLSGQGNKPFYRLLYDRSGSQSWVKADVSFEHKPRHPIYQDKRDGQVYDSWLRAHLAYGRRGDRVRWDGALGAGSNVNMNLPYGGAYLSLSLKGEYEFIPGWSVYGEFLGQPDSSASLPHIGNIITTGVWGNLILFRQNLALKAHLWGTGWVGRNAYFRYDVLNEVPYTKLNALPTPDQVALHFELFATINTVVITFRAMNLLNVLSPMAGGLKQDLIWLRPGDFYPTLGRLISFGVAWDFKD